MSELSVKRNSCLYGPRRENTNTVVKDFLVKDNVLPKDDCNVKKSWETTSDACFGKKTVKLDRTTAKLSTEIQRLSNFEFGSDFRTHPLMTTTSFEFGKNVLPPVKRVVQDFYSTNIPDFCHSRMQVKMIGDDGSIYASSFKTSETCSNATAKRRVDLQRKQTDDMRSTHFNLGSNKQRMYSETVDSYHNRSLDNSCIETTSFKKTGPSSVFRSGDWNMSEPCVTETSVSQHDFSPQKNLAAVISRNQFSAINNNDHSQSTIKGFAAKNSTNFKLGSDKCLNSSVYQTDFLQEKRPLKPLRPARLKSSKFLQHTPGMGYPKSTKESNFVYKHEEALDFLKSRMYEFERNQNRHKVSCVALSDEQGLTKPLKQVTMTLKDYQKPPTDILCSRKLQRRPVPKYDYILLDKGLIQPQYETTQGELHKAHLSKPLDANSSSSKDCNERSRDDHQTHFVLGSDYLSTVKSEQHDQFTKKATFDPCSPTAGYNRRPVVRSNNIFASDDNSFDASIQNSSVMKTDYLPSTKQRVSSAQRRLLALSSRKQSEVMPSHYFHMNHGNERTVSTTTNDYIPPELMAGQADILTR